MKMAHCSTIVIQTLDQQQNMITVRLWSLAMLDAYKALTSLLNQACTGRSIPGFLEFFCGDIYMHMCVCVRPLGYK